MFEGLFGSFTPQMPSDPAMPMAINQDGQNGQGLFGNLFGGLGQQQGGGLLGLNFSGNQPLYDLGGRGSGLLGFGTPQQNPMMRFGLNMASPGMGNMFQPQQQQQTFSFMPRQQPQQSMMPPDYAFRGGFASPSRRA